jgi:hypothetical protein
LQGRLVLKGGLRYDLLCWVIYVQLFYCQKKPN